MFYFIAIWMLLLVPSWLLGTACLRGLQAHSFDRQGDRTMVALWLGIVIWADLLLLVSLKIPLSPGVGVAIVAGSVLLLLWSPSMRAEMAALWPARLGAEVMIGLGWTILVATYMTQQVTWFDTGLYHFGAIRWLSGFGAVPGLALLIEPLGFTSSWFALAAPVNVAALAPRGSAVVNGFLVWLATCHGGLSLWRWLNGQARIADRFLVMFLGGVLPVLGLTRFLSAIVVSPSPDIPVIFLAGVIAWTILMILNHPGRKAGAQISNHWDVYLVPVILAGGAVSIKLSALPLLPIALLFYWGQQPVNLRRFFMGGLVALSLLIPLITVSIVTSGCPFYPSTAFCLDTPWRLPAERAHNAVELIRGWNRWFGSPPAGANPVFWRLWQWLTFARLNLVMLVLLILSVVGMGLTYRVARKHAITGLSWVFALGLAGMVFILLRAPMIRFGLGYFVVIPALAIAILGPVSWGWIWKPKVAGCWQGGMMRRLTQVRLIALAGILAITLSPPSVRARWLLPPAMPTATVEPKWSHNFVYVSPVGDQMRCWDAPLPCSPSKGHIQLRDPDRGLEAGFVPASNQPD